MPAKTDRRAGFGLGLLCFFAYFPAIFAATRGGLPFGGDAIAAFGPWHVFTREAIWRGILPLWNPHVFCGMPFMANGQSAVLYPPNLIYGLLPLRFALLGDAWAHNFLLALGTYCLARTLGQSRSAALLAAGVLALSGAVSARLYAGHMTWHAARAWTPWLLWALLCFLRSGRPRYALLWALFGALQLGAGHPPVALLSLALCAGLFIARATSRRRRGLCVLPNNGWVLLLAATLLMLALSAATWLPLVESTRLSTHGGFGFEFATRGSGTWKSLVRLLLPDFFGGNFAPQWSLRDYGYEEAASLGILAALLVVFSPFLARDVKRLPRAVPWLWLLIPIAFTLALGKHTPIYRFAFENLPGFSSLRVPVRWLELWLLPGALLAGFSCDELFARRSNAGASRAFCWTLAAIAGLLASLALIAALSSPSEWPWIRFSGTFTPDQWRDALRLRDAAVIAALISFTVSAVGAKILFDAPSVPRNRTIRLVFVALALGEMLGLFWRSAQIPAPNQNIAWPPQVLAEFQAGQRWESSLGGAAPQINGGLTHGVDLFNGYDPAAPRDFFRFASALEGWSFYSLCYQIENRSSLLRVAGVTQGLSAKFSRHHYSGAWPRIYLTRHVLRFPKTRQLAALQRLSQGDFASQNQPAVAAPEAFSLIREGKMLGRVVSWKRDLNQLDVDLKIGSPTVLVAGEAWYPGWRAFMLRDGHTLEAKIETANYLFRGVALPSGTSHVTMIYEPQSQRLGFFLSLLGIGVFSGAATFLLHKRQHDQTQHPSGL